MSIDVAERTIPHDLQAERAVLGSILITNDIIFDVAEILTDADFYRDAHRRIFRVLLSLNEAKTAIDWLTLRDALTRTNDLDHVGGPAYLFGLTDGVPRSTNAVHYAQIVRERSTQRAIVLAAQKTMAAAFDAEVSAHDVLDAAQSALFKIGDRRIGGAFVDMPTLMADALGYVETLAADKRHVTGVPSGFIDLDAYTRGFQSQDLIVIAARPSMGKTSLAMNIAENAAIQHRLRVGVFSLEMGRKALGLRLLASQARIDHHRLLSGRLYDSDWAAMSAAVCRLTEAGIHVDDSAAVTVFDIRAKARRLKADKGLDLIVIDYLQLLNAPQRAENKNLEVAANTKALKAIAKDLNIPIVLLSQLSRDVERRSEHRPQLSDLRDSGSIEQDADVILFIYREEKYYPTADNAGVAEIIIGKQRNGPTGVVKLTFSDHLVRFDNRSALPSMPVSVPAPERMPYAEARS